MPRIRTIKPGFFKSEDVSALPFRARLTWVGLWTQCDDHGRYKDSVRLIKGDVWPLDDVSLRDIEEDLSILEEQRRLVRYEVDGKRYLAVVNWHAHQAINRPGKPKHPAPPEPLGSSNPDDENHCDICAQPGIGSLIESSRATHGALTEDSRQEGNGREWKGGDARVGASGDPPAPGIPAFLPPEQPDKINPTGHHGLQECPAGTQPGQLDPVGTTPPPDKCARHLDSVKPPACGPCADARKNRADWDAERARRARSAPKCPRHRGQPADNCGPCRSEALAAETDVS